VNTPIRDVKKLLAAGAAFIVLPWYTLTRLFRLATNGSSSSWLVKVLIMDDASDVACKTAAKLLSELASRRKTLLLLNRQLPSGFTLRGELQSGGVSLRSGGIEVQQLLHRIFEDASDYLACVERFLGRYDAPALAQARQMHHDFLERVAAFRVDNMRGLLEVGAFKRFLLEGLERHDRLLASSYRTFALSPYDFKQEMLDVTVKPVKPVPSMLAPRLPYRVLHIEDNLESLRLMRLVLAGRNDLKLLEAETSKFGLELAHAEKPSVILLDIGLPDVNGYDTLVALRASADTADIPVIAISAHPPKNIGCGPNVVFDEYITKPYDIVHLMTTVDRALKSHSRAA
jgi:hypothetical protein